MRRREFIAGLVSAAASPFAAHAQQSRMRRVGILVNAPESDAEMQAFLGAFRLGFEKLGWSEGRNVRVDVRFAANADAFQPLAKELVALQPEVILARATPVVAAIRRESRTVPIIFTSVSDPIGSGFVESLARPGGNITGFLLYEDGITGKWLAMLKEIAPRLTRVAIIGNPKNTPYEYFLRSAEAAAAKLAIEIVPSRVDNAADIEHAIESFARVPNGGLLFLPDIASQTNPDLIIRLRLPAVYSLRRFVAAGGLMSYDTDRLDQVRQAASYVDRILKGEKPADLPVQAPTRFETVVNLKTAKALGLTIPETLLATADEVIQ